MLKISWSQLRTHEECRHQAQLMRERKKLKTQDKRNFFPGTVTDRVVRDWLAGNPRESLGLMPHMVESIIARELEVVKDEGGAVKWRDTEDRDNVLRDCIEAVTKIEPLLIEHVLPHTWKVDHRFSVELGIPDLDDSLAYITLIGAIDVMVETDAGDIDIWDVKHTRDNGYWRKTVGQLTFYDLYAFAEKGRDTRKVGLLQPLCNEPEFVYELDDGRRSALLQRVIAMAHDVWRGDTPPTDATAPCHFCPVKHACVKFKPSDNGRISLL